MAPPAAESTPSGRSEATDRRVSGRAGERAHAIRTPLSLQGRQRQSQRPWAVCFPWRSDGLRCAGTRGAAWARALSPPESGLDAGQFRERRTRLCQPALRKPVVPRTAPSDARGPPSFDSRHGEPRQARSAHVCAPPRPGRASRGALLIGGVRVCRVFRPCPAKVPRGRPRCDLVPPVGAVGPRSLPAPADLLRRCSQGREGERLLVGCATLGLLPGTRCASKVLRHQLVSTASALRESFAPPPVRSPPSAPSLASTTSTGGSGTPR